MSQGDMDVDMDEQTSSKKTKDKHSIPSDDDESDHDQDMEHSHKKKKKHKEKERDKVKHEDDEDKKKKKKDKHKHDDDEDKNKRENGHEYKRKRKRDDDDQSEKQDKKDKEIKSKPKQDQEGDDKAHKKNRNKTPKEADVEADAEIRQKWKETDEEQETARLAAEFTANQFRGTTPGMAMTVEKETNSSSSSSSSSGEAKEKEKDKRDKDEKPKDKREKETTKDQKRKDKDRESEKRKEKDQDEETTKRKEKDKDQDQETSKRKDKDQDQETSKRKDKDTEKRKEKDKEQEQATKDEKRKKDKAAKQDEREDKKTKAEEEKEKEENENDEQESNKNKQLISIEKPLFINPNSYLDKDPRYFRNIKINRDVTFVIFIADDGPNEGKPGLRCCHVKNKRTDLEVTAPFGKVIRAFFGGDGNFRDPKSQKYINDKVMPTDAKQTISFIAAGYHEANTDENGFDIDYRDYVNWLLELGAAFYQAVCQFKELMSGSKDNIIRLLKLEEAKPEKQAKAIYNGLLTHYRGPAFEGTEEQQSQSNSGSSSATSTSEKKEKPKRKIQDPKEVRCGKSPLWFVHTKTDVFRKFKPGKKNRKKPEKGPVIESNQYLSMMWQMGYLYVWAPLFERFSPKPVPWEKAHLRSGDLVSVGQIIRCYLAGKDPDTQELTIGISQKLQYARIWERGGFMTAEQKAVLYVPPDAPLPGEHDGIVWDDQTVETFRITDESTFKAKLEESSKLTTVATR